MGRFYIRLAAVGGAVAVVLLADSSGVLPARGALILDDSAQLAAGVFASVCCAFAASRVGGVERTWRRLMALGMVGWSVGQLLWSWYQIVDHQPLPSPSPADIGYLSLPVFAVPALLVMAVDTRRTRSEPTRSVVPSRLVLIFDGLIVVGSLLILTWVTTLGAVVHAGAPTALAFAVAVAYPLTDLVLVVMVVLLLSTQPAPLRLRPQLVLLGLGLSALALSNSIFAYLVAGGAQTMPPITNAGFVAGPLLVGLAALTTSPASRNPPRQTGQRVRSGPPSVAWAHLLLPYLPLIVTGIVMVVLEVAGREQQSVAIYLGFPLIALVIIRQMITLIDNATLLRRVTRAQRRLRHQALHDPLTNLANRSLFQTRLAKAIDPVAAPGGVRQVALYFIDLDDFKNVNDAFGHVIGDRVLAEVARRVRSALRGSDLVARLGGDEFGVLIDDNVGDPYATGSRILDAIRQPFSAHGHKVAISASIGAVVADITAGLNADQLLTYADRAMYAGKQQGKATLTITTPESLPDTTS